MSAENEQVQEFDIRRPDDFSIDDIANQETSSQGHGFNEQLDPLDTVGTFLRQAGRVPLLTAEQEVELATRIERGEKAREKLAEGVDNEKEVSRLSYFVQDGLAATEHMLTANTRLVVSVTKKYQGRGLEFGDLIQEGEIGLIRALKKFEYQRGHKFSTYATWWIKQAVSRAVKDQGRTIRIPILLGDTISRINRTEFLLTQELGRTPTLDELSQAVKIPTENLADIKRVSQKPISLDLYIDEDEERELIQRIEDSTAIRPEDNAERILMYQKIRDRIGILNPKEQEVIGYRFGFTDGVDYTLEEVGQKMGITRERVRQIEDKALRKLRKPEKM